MTPWTSELLEDGAGTTTRVEDMIKEMVSTLLASKEIVTIAGRPGITRGNAPLPQNGKSKGKGFQGECYNCGEKGHPARECPKGKEGGKSKGKGDSYKGKGKGSWSRGKGIWQVDGE